MKPKDATAKSTRPKIKNHANAKAYDDDDNAILSTRRMRTMSNSDGAGSVYVMSLRSVCHIVGITPTANWHAKATKWPANRAANQTASRQSVRQQSGR